MKLTPRSDFVKVAGPGDLDAYPPMLGHQPGLNYRGDWMSHLVRGR